MPLNTAKVVFCPQCERKLCKIKDMPAGPVVEVRHKGLVVMSKIMAIFCISCKTPYTVNAPDASVRKIAG